jgi:selenoprotein W-related protein
MDQYLNQGQFRSIPTFVFFDAAFNELGHWIERPARVSALQAQMRRELFAHDPLLAPFAPDTPFGQLPEAAQGRLREANQAFRETHRDLSDREVVREIRVLLEQGVAQPAVAVQPAVTRTPSAPGVVTPSARGEARVSITYCAECGYEPQTLALTSALMQEFVHDLAAIEIIPWQDGAFDVAVNGDLVHSMYRDGGFPEHATIIQAVRQRLGR